MIGRSWEFLHWTGLNWEHIANLYPYILRGTDMKPNFVTTLFAVTVLGAIVLAQSTSRTTSNHNSTDRKYDYAIVLANGDTHSWGSWNTQELRNLDAGTKADRIIVRKDEKNFVFTDGATVKAAQKAIEPVMALAKRQGELGRRQGELGREQGQLGRKQGELGRQQGDLGRQLGQIVREMQSESTRAEARRKQDDINRKMQALGEQQSALGKEQGELGKRQSVLGEQQGELGRQQAAESKKADAEITKLIDNAFAKGLTREIK